MTTTGKDLYPSRVSSEPNRLMRVDPVVWGAFDAVPDAQLTQEQLENFRDDGFLWLEGLFGQDEIESFNTELQRMARDPELPESETSVAEDATDTLNVVFDIHRRSTAFKELAKDRRLAHAARQILNSDVYIHQSRIDVKPALREAGVFWRSDFETWHTEDGLPRCRTVCALVALDEINEFNGPVMMMPGSHKTFVSCVGDPEGNGQVEAAGGMPLGTPDAENLKHLMEDGGIVAPKGPAGSLLLFDCNVMQASASNLTPYPRASVVYVFNSVENAAEAPFAARSPRPDYVGSRDFTPVSQL